MKCLLKYLQIEIVLFSTRFTKVKPIHIAFNVNESHGEHYGSYCRHFPNVV